MNILRKGTHRDKGTFGLVVNKPLMVGNRSVLDDTLRWDQNSKCIVMAARGIPHPDRKTHHNYSVHLSVDDLVCVIRLLGKIASTKDAKALGDPLNAHVSSLVNLLACATGAVATPMQK